MDDHQERSAQQAAERFESIPWSALAPAEHSGRSRWLVAAGTVVVGLVVGLAAGMYLRRGDSATVVTLPAQVTVPEPQFDGPVVADTQLPVHTAVASAPETSQPTQTAAPVSLPPRLYSEADLMAVLPEEEQRLAALRAEWFVTDFFTVDGSGAGAVVAALPEGFDGASLPHSQEGRAVSYTEWARAFRIDPVGPGRYEIAVAFRTLGGPDPASLVRSAVRAVVVTVEVDATGASVVLDLPAPVDAPGTLAVRWVGIAEGEPAGDLRQSAIDAAGRIGTDAGLAVAGTDADGWRLVVIVGDASGLRWPLAVRP